MALLVYNTLTRRKEPFSPREPGAVGMYVCGNTVYDYAHVGHARVWVAFDVVVRYLRHRGYRVRYVRNITDVDDKILRRAAELGEPFTALTERMIAAQREDERSLGVLPPDVEPRATEHVEDMIDMIQILVDNHYAYVAANGDVYFRVKRFPEYGKLSGRNPDELLAGARVEVGEQKEDPRDFALWKRVPEDEPGWPSPWGHGRPGWHIECSAMSTCHLGDSFDIHGGGPDLIFPHHENEIAQSEAATRKPFAQLWMHVGAVRVADEKMSKSLGNFVTIREVLARHPGEVLRYFLLASHYRSPLNFTEQGLAEARAALDRLYGALRGLAAAPAEPRQLGQSLYYRRFRAAMDDDFNTPEALAVLFDLARELNTARRAGDTEGARRLAGELLALGEILGLLQQDPEAWFAGEEAGGLSRAEIEALIAERAEAKAARDFARADAIRETLRRRGIVLEDSREGTTWRRIEPSD